MPIQPPAQARCPEESALRKFLDDELPAEDAARVDHHLGACAACQRVLDRMIGGLPPGLMSSTAVNGAAEERPPFLEGYETLGPVAAGGMGEVWRVRDLELGRDLAVKVLKPSASGDSRTVERFLTEARITGRLAHPFIVPVHGMGRLADGRPCYTMKLVQGRTLADLLGGRADLASGRAELVRIFGQVCQAVAYAHGQGVIHRDLKPHNVMVGEHGEVQLMDWGLAKVLGGADPLAVEDREAQGASADTRHDDGRYTRTGSVLGTLAYMPPEQARGLVDQVDRRADVFGLGAILCEILTGKPPYVGQTRYELERQASHGELAGAFARLEGCGADPELVALARQCLMAEPGGRPADAEAVVGCVTAYLESVEARLRRAEQERAAAQAKASAERRARRLAVGLAAAGLLLVVLGGGAFWWSERQRLALEQREATTRETVEGALRQLPRLYKEYRWEDAGELLAQTGNGLEGAAFDDLRRRVAEARADVEFVVALDEVFQKKALWTDGSGRAKTKWVGRDTLYKEEFLSRGFDFERGDLKELAQSVADSAIKDHLIAILDLWSGNEPDLRVRERLRAVARLADPDEVRDALGKSDRDRLVRLAKSLDVKRHSPATLLALGGEMIKVGADPADLLRRAQQQYPRDWGLCWNLGNWLRTRGANLEAAIGYYRAALAIRPRSVASRVNLSLALQLKREWDQAATVLEESVQLAPSDLVRAKLLVNLGSVLLDKGDLPAALAVCRQAVRLDPEAAEGHGNLANALNRLGRRREALAHYQKATDLDPESAMLQDNYGLALKADGQLGEAIVRFRLAIAADPQFAKAYYSLGQCLLAIKEFDGAVIHYRKAADLVPGDPKNHGALGTALAFLGLFAEARASLGRAVDLLPKGDPLRKYAESEVAWCDRLAERERQLGAIDAGRVAEPKLAADLVGLGAVCHAKAQFARAARYYRAALAGDPGLADSVTAGRRESAACSAALAGTGRGKDATDLDEAARAAWRKQALDWLRADLLYWSRLSEGEDPRPREAARLKLLSWQYDGELAGLREPAAVAKLPPDERAACERFWRQVDEQARRASRGSPAG